jgi:hypothetical protein
MTCVLALPVGSADAITRKNSTGTVTCTVTAANPTLASGVVNAAVTYSCTASVKLWIRVGIAEVDGTSTKPSYQYPGSSTVYGLPLTITTVTGSTLTASFNTSTKFSTKVKCFPSETGNEEYTTALMISYDGKTYYGRTDPVTGAQSTSIPEYSNPWPALDSYAC